MLMLHMTSGAAAIILGALVYLFPKGTRRHRCLARTYLIAMVGCTGTALLMHKYGLLTSSHGLALAAICCMAGAFIAVRRKVPAGNWRLYHHLFGASSYYILLFTTLKRLATRDEAENFVAIANHDVYVMLQVAVAVLVMAIVVYHWPRRARRPASGRLALSNPSHAPPVEAATSTAAR
jgi:uncharacterized membrane protein